VNAEPEVSTTVPEVGAPEPAAAPTMPKMTRKDWGRIMNAQFTVRGFDLACGHKLSLARNAEGKFYIPSDPKNNCDVCWFSYFNNNGSMVQLADECFTVAGRDVLERSRGKKFVKYFLRFMSTVARFQREEAAKAAAQENSNGNTNNDTNVTDGASGRGAGDSATDSSEPGLAGEAQEVNGVTSGSDRTSGGSETSLDSSEVEGLGTGDGAVQQGLDD
jgi:hypothetical protein